MVSFVVRVLDDGAAAGRDRCRRAGRQNLGEPDLAPPEQPRSRRHGDRSLPRRLIVFRSTGTSFVDTDIQAGARYRYRVASYDWADNHSLGVDVHTTAVNAKLIEPQDWAQLTRPPLLAWARVPGADYYNVQLWAIVPGGLKKVLSIWPSSNHLQLQLEMGLRGSQPRAHPGAIPMVRLAGSRPAGRRPLRRPDRVPCLRHRPLSLAQRRRSPVTPADRTRDASPCSRPWHPQTPTRPYRSAR